MEGHFKLIKLSHVCYEEYNDILFKNAMAWNFEELILVMNTFHYRLKPNMSI